MLSLTADADDVVEQDPFFSTPIAPAFVSVSGLGVVRFTDDIYVRLQINLGNTGFVLFVDQTTNRGVFGVTSPL